MVDLAYTYDFGALPTTRTVEIALGCQILWQPLPEGKLRIRIIATKKIQENIKPANGYPKGKSKFICNQL